MTVSFLVLLASLFFIFPQFSHAACPIIPTTPIIITTCEQLQNISIGSTGYFVLGNDIDCSSIENFIPIIDFYGKFDGNNHIIKNITITKENYDSNVALFGTIYSSAVISNLKLEDVNIIGGDNVGSLVGIVFNTNNSECNVSTLENINVTGSISGSTYVGGLIGKSQYVNINNCNSSVSVTGTDRVGGLVGSAYQYTIDKSYSTGSVSSNGNYTGGLVGFLDSSNVTKSYSTGSIYSTGNFIGGLIGFMYNSHLEDSYSTSNVTSTYDQEGGFLGGLVGYDEIYEEISCASIIRSYSSGTLTADPIIFIGGLVGGVKGDPITDSFTTSQDSSGNYLALTGFNIDNSSTITNSYSVTTETPVITFTNRSSPVFTNWDFSTVWLGTSGLPSFSDIVIPSSDSNSVSIYSDSPSTPDCQNLRLRAPDLFQINTTKNSAKLFFTPIDTNQFYISFSTNPNAEENGELVTLSSEGVQSHTIYHLKPNTTYYIKVRGQNGCMPGKWSDILTFKTNNTIFYKYVSKSTSAVFTPTPTPTLIPTSTIKPTSIPTSTQPVKSNSTPTSKKCFLWWCW